MAWSLVMGIPLLILQFVEIDSPDLNSFFTMIGYSFPFVLVINGARKRMIRNHGYFSGFHFGKISPYILFLLIPLTMAMGLISEQLAYLIPGTEALEYLMQDMLQPSVFTFFTIVICAPLLEEILFRGIIMDGFLKYKSPGESIFWSALFFGAIHLIPAQALSAFIAGLFIGWLYWRTRSLWACMFVHFINNLLSYGLFLYYGDVTTNQILETSTLIQLLITSILVLLVGMWVIKRRSNPPLAQVGN